MKVFYPGFSGSSPITSLTDNTSGSANDTLEAMADVGIDTIIAADQSDVNDRLAALRNNLADLSAKVNEILAALRTAGVIGS